MDSCCCRYLNDTVAIAHDHSKTKQSNGLKNLDKVNHCMVSGGTWQEGYDHKQVEGF